VATLPRPVLTVSGASIVIPFAAWSFHRRLLSVRMPTQGFLMVNLKAEDGFSELVEVAPQGSGSTSSAMTAAASLHGARIGAKATSNMSAHTAMLGSTMNSIKPAKTNISVEKAKPIEKYNPAPHF